MAEMQNLLLNGFCDEATRPLSRHAVQLCEVSALTALHFSALPSSVFPRLAP